MKEKLALMASKKQDDQSHGDDQQGADGSSQQRRGEAKEEPEVNSKNDDLYEVIEEEEAKPPALERDDVEVEWKLMRDEALALARYWTKERCLWPEVSYFYTAQTGGGESRLGAWANSRLNLIADLIGEAAVKQVVAEVQGEERKSMGELLWAIFTKGTKEDWAFVADVTWRLVFGSDWGCPICERHSGGLRFAESNVYWCEKDRVYWCLAAGDSSSTPHSAGVSLEDQQREWDRIGLSEFEKVEPRRLRPSGVES